MSELLAHFAKPLPSGRIARWVMVFTFLTAVMVILVFRLRYLIVVEVTSDSMAPTILRGDRLLFLRNAYHNSAPSRGDIVVLENPLREGELVVKRVIGLPGEYISCYGGRVYISGKLLDEPYVKGANTIGIQPIIIPAGFVYLLGDNRASSEDSRDFGPVPIDRLLGKLWIRILPFSRFGKVK